VRVTYVGPRSYIPAGSHSGQLVNIPGLGDMVSPPQQQASFARMVAVSVTVSVLTQLLVPVVLRVLRGKRP